MNLPIAWLKKYLDLQNISVEDLENTYTMLGFMKDAPTKNGVLSLEIRQNRPDCLSILGLARELSAVKNLSLNSPSPKGRSPSGRNIPNKKILDIKEPTLVKRFTAIHLDNIKIESSPQWMQEPLTQYGITPINNIVDITNFVMVEMGQPMHPFDANKISGDKLTVRLATNKEQLETFEGQKIALSNEDLIIADNKNPIALAGIIGTSTSGIDKATTAVILEAAVYNNTNVRKSSRRLNIRTEASTRLEKFLHPKQTMYAIEKAVELIKEIIPNATITEIDDYYPSPPKEKVVSFDYNLVNKLGGVNLAEAQINHALTAFGFLEPKYTIPYYRTDIEIPEDLVEEVLRFYGYQNIPTIKINNAPPSEITPNIIKLTNSLKELLVSAGFHEHITNPLVQYDKNDKRILLDNPLNKENNSLRVSILETLEKVSKTYSKHKIGNFKIFEIGKIYHKVNNSFVENESLCCIFSPDHDIRRVNGYLESIIKFLGLPLDGIVSRNENSFEISLVGIIDFSKVTSGAKLSWDYKHYYSEEISFLYPKKDSLGEVFNTIVKNSPKETQIEFIDNYKGKEIPENFFSALIKVTILSTENIDPKNAVVLIDKVRSEITKMGLVIRGF